MRTIVLADHMGIERLTKSFGLVALFQGVAFIANAPLAGELNCLLGIILQNIFIHLNSMRMAFFIKIIKI